MRDEFFEANRQRVLAMGGEGKQADLQEALVLADYFTEFGSPQLTASALDVAYGLNPEDPGLAHRRIELLDSLAIRKDGFVLRYIPAGTFLMGSDSGDPDESPVHAKTLDEFWMADVPTSWALYCQSMDWSAPPTGAPTFDESNRRQGFNIMNLNKIRLSYCETGTLQGRDWHAHATHQKWRQGDQILEAHELFGEVPREDPSAPHTYDVKPVIAIAWQDAAQMCESISNSKTRYGLPSEAQWEKAARGGLVQHTYPWGSEPPDQQLCDFDHFGDWVIHDPRRFPPNGYGLHGMCGTVWEWTSDEYDALSYSQPNARAGHSEERQHVLRGGSWIDCMDAVTVSFRMSRGSRSWEDEAGWSPSATPTIGFRVCCTTTG